jgi:CheY-like chemotaxis protein/CRP-like cAMP-binding protein
MKPLRMKKVLLIEDNREVRETTQEILELADFIVSTAENGKEGVKMAKASKPDVIICDIMMPELDGYGVLQILSRNPETSAIPFIFLTAKADKTDFRKGMNLGADDYLTKPFEELELIQTIEARLAKSQSIKITPNSSNNLNDFIDQARGFKELKDLSGDRKIKTFNNKETIFREDDQAHTMYYVVKGNVKCFRSDNYGKSYVHQIHGEGDFIGYMSLFEEGTYGESAVAIENTELAVIQKQEFLDLIYKNRDVAANFIKLLSKDVVDREKKLLQLAYSPVRERLADILIKLLTKSPNQIDTNHLISISREDLANMVGTAKESLIRTLSEFKKEGVISTNGQEIRILDEKSLERTAIGF